MNKKRKIILSYKIILFIILCILLNLAGRILTLNVAIPLWLDSVGTCLASVFIGPLAGITVAVVSSVIYLFLNCISVYYIFVSIATALIVGLVYPKRVDTFQILLTAYYTALVSGCLSVMVNLIISDGYIGNIWADALFEYLKVRNVPTLLCSLAGQSLIEFPDKVLVLLIVTAVISIYKEVEKIKQEVKG